MSSPRWFLVTNSVSLRKYPEKLDALRKRLGLLWGNVEKKQSGQLPQIPHVFPPAAPTPDAEQEQPKRKSKKRKKGKKKAAVAEQNKRAKTDHDAELETPQPRLEDEEPKFFDACVKEYGHERMDGTKHRMWRIFETTIKLEGVSE